MNHIYLARKFTPESEYDIKSYYEEAFFSTYSEAEQFIKNECLEDDPDFYSEIKYYPFGKYDPSSEIYTWYFSNKGELLHTTDLSIEQFNEFNNSFKSFTHKFSIGDLVYIQAFPNNKFNNLWKDIIGFVARPPIPFKQWISEGNAENDWDCCYLIYYINSKGYMDHNHVPEIAMTSYTLTIPKDLSFLQIYAEIAKKKTATNRDYDLSIWINKIIVKKIETVDIKKLLTTKNFNDKY